jgi:hypothetical protein
MCVMRSNSKSLHLQSACRRGFTNTILLLNALSTVNKSAITTIIYIIFLASFYNQYVQHTTQQNSRNKTNFRVRTALQPMRQTTAFPFGSIVISLTDWVFLYVLEFIPRACYMSYSSHGPYRQVLSKLDGEELGSSLFRYQLRTLFMKHALCLQTEVEKHCLDRGVKVCSTWVNVTYVLRAVLSIWEGEGSTAVNTGKERAVLLLILVRRGQ